MQSENNENNENKMTMSLEENMRYLRERLQPDTSFDIVYRVLM